MVVKNRGPLNRIRVRSVGRPSIVIGCDRPALMSEACDNVTSRTPGTSLRRRCRSA